MDNKDFRPCKYCSAPIGVAHDDDCRYGVKEESEDHCRECGKWLPHMNDITRCTGHLDNFLELGEYADGLRDKLDKKTGEGFDKEIALGKKLSTLKNTATI